MFKKILIVVILNLILFVLNIYSYYLNQIKEINNIEIIDKRKYGRANILFLKKMNRKEE